MNSYITVNNKMIIYEFLINFIAINSVCVHKIWTANENREIFGQIF